MPETTFQDDMRDAIQQVLHKHDDHTSSRGVITAWVLVVELVGDDGDPYLHTIRATDAGIWRQIGMLQVAHDSCMQSIRDDFRGSDD